MVAWHCNTTLDTMRGHFEEIAADVRAECGVDVKQTDMRPEFLGAYHACSERVRSSLRKMFVKNIQHAQAEGTLPCPM